MSLMKTLRGPALAIAAFGAICAVFVTCASARADQSAWVEGFNNKVRLIGIAAPPEGSKAAFMAGVEIEMTPGFKTYWRSPGDAGGVPPEFDWSGSDNLASARVLYPAPHRLIDKAGANIGYKDRVIFPVEITPTDPAKPVTLRLRVTYGVCKNICIPAEAELELGLSGQSESSAELAAARGDVPNLLAAGAKPRDAATPVLSSWRIENRGGSSILVLEVTGAGEDGDVFLFSDEGLYLPMLSKVKSAEPVSVFEGDLSDGANLKELAGKSIWVTISGAKGQSESLIGLPKDIAQK
jgi:DsbC/DsbD-like thiol-disulfide interchange protein